MVYVDCRIGNPIDLYIIIIIIIIYFFSLLS
jgi:hypothetical protein